MAEEELNIEVAAEPVKSETRFALPVPVPPAQAADLPLLRIEGVGKKFGSFRAADQLSLDIRAGEFFALLGPSACGNPTLLQRRPAFHTPHQAPIPFPLPASPTAYGWGGSGGWRGRGGWAAAGRSSCRTSGWRRWTRSCVKARNWN